jgi:ATP-dependent RNA helicase DOB1
VAAEVESVDELLITELIFEGIFNDLEPAACVGLLACMFPGEKSRKTATLRAVLVPGLAALHKSARHVAEIQKECKVEIDVELYVQSFGTTLANITYDWCKGLSFPEIMADTDLFEGGVIRIMRRLEELMRELVQAAEAIGNGELAAKFEAGRKGLKRGIVFTGSLYTE